MKRFNIFYILFLIVYKMSYDYEDIKNLAKKINDIHNKNHMIKIINIIKQENPNIDMTETQNGIFVKFNSLNINTYKEIENYIKKYV